MNLINKLFKMSNNPFEYMDFSGPTIIMPNHVSLLDAVLLHFNLPPEVQFMVTIDTAKRFSFIKYFREFEIIDPMNLYSAKRVIKKIKRGIPIVIFPEGRITVTGSPMKINSDIAYFALKTGAKIYPVAIDGAERSKLSYIGDKVKTQVFPTVKMTVGESVVFDLDPSVSSRVQSENASIQILKLLQAELLNNRLKRNVNLFNELLNAAKLNGPGLTVSEDPKGRLTYKKLIIGSYVLGDKLADITDSETIGVLLPTSNAGMLLLFSMFYIGKTPVMLNFTMGEQTILDACKTAGIDTVISSRQFIEKGNLHHIESALSKGSFKILYMEEIGKSVTKTNKLAGLQKYLLHRKANSNSNKIVLFTSGSEGKPKGVVLSHDNIFANLQQARTVIDFTSKDRIFDVLPMFHSFGLTAGIILPVILGVPVYLYPSPLHYKNIPELIYSKNATLLFGTSTFLDAYGRNAHQYDFHSLRHIVAGAEKLKKETVLLWFDKFGKRILEGYGVTEASPVVSLNTPLLNKPGTVGQLLPGMRYKIEKIEGIDEGGNLLLKGPNIMSGYLINEKGFIPADEWYRTGDIVDIDSDGYLSIKSRLKRFAKIGGEMVSLNLIEEIAAECFGTFDVAAVSIPDQIKGEKITLFVLDQYHLTTLKKYMIDHGYAAITIPSKISVINEFPLLGSGKTDYVKLQLLAD